MKKKEKAVLTMTDIHYGKETSSYNPEVCDIRLRLLSERIAKIRDILVPSYNIDELVITLLGDINDGTDIYRTQPHHQAITNVEQQAREVAHLLHRFFVEQGEVWGQVSVHCVAGNHGRAFRSNSHEAANWDMVAYCYMELLSHNNPHVTVHIPTDPFLQVLNIFGHGILMTHGHFIKSYLGIPWYGIIRRLLQWSATRAIPRWDVAVMGHFHSCGDWAINSQQSMMLSGAMPTDDEWALQLLGVETVPSWWLFGVSESRAQTWQWKLNIAPDMDRDSPEADMK